MNASMYIIVRTPRNQTNSIFKFGEKGVYVLSTVNKSLYVIYFLKTGANYLAFRFNVNCWYYTLPYLSHVKKMTSDMLQCKSIK